MEEVTARACGLRWLEPGPAQRLCSLLPPLRSAPTPPSTGRGTGEGEARHGVGCDPGRVAGWLPTLEARANALASGEGWACLALLPPAWGIQAWGSCPNKPGQCQALVCAVLGHFSWHSWHVSQAGSNGWVIVDITVWEDADAGGGFGQGGPQEEQVLTRKRGQDPLLAERK